MSAEIEEVPWTQAGAAKKLGLPEARVRELRRGLAVETDWRRTREGIVFTEAGMAKMAAAVKAVLEPDAAPVARWVEPPEVMWQPFTKDEVTVVTLRRKLANPVVVEGQLEDGRIVRLRLKPSPAWREGMKLPSVQLAEDFFEYRGLPPLNRERWR